MYPKLAVQCLSDSVVPKLLKAETIVGKSQTVELEHNLGKVVPRDSAMTGCPNSMVLTLNLVQTCQRI